MSDIRPTCWIQYNPKPISTTECQSALTIQCQRRFLFTDVCYHLQTLSTPAAFHSTTSVWIWNRRQSLSREMEYIHRLNPSLITYFVNKSIQPHCRLASAYSLSSKTARCRHGHRKRNFIASECDIVYAAMFRGDFTLHTHNRKWSSRRLSRCNLRMKLFQVSRRVEHKKTRLNSVVIAIGNADCACGEI